MKIEVPHYKQTTEYTCGPSSLIMVLKYFRPKMRISRELEFEIWHSSLTLPFRGTESFGLARFARKFGLKAEVIKEKRGFFFKTKAKRFPTIKDLEIARLTFEKLRKEAIKAGVREKYEKITIYKIKKFIRMGIPPIAAVNASYTNGCKDLHWVVVKGFDENYFYLNDPETKNKKISIKLSYKSFQQVLNLRRFGTERRIVLIYS